MKAHRLSNNHPMVSVILAMTLSVILVDSIAATAGSGTLFWLVKAFVAAVLLFLQQWWFSPEYKGALKTELPLREAVKLSVPYWLLMALSYACNWIDFGPVFSPTVLAITMAVGAGVSEEM